MSFLPAKATPSAIDFNGLSKRFGGVQALDNVSFGVARGECHALMGENGAGKSTLGKILAGIHRPDAGSLRIHDAACIFRSPRAAMRAGVGMVHQELAFCPDLSVAENLCLGQYPRRGRVFLDRRAMEARARSLLDEIGVTLDVRQAMKHGIGLVPEDRKQQGLVLGMSCRHNFSLVILDRLRQWGLLRHGPEARGVDVGAKAAIHELIDELAKQRLAVHADLQRTAGGVKSLHSHSRDARRAPRWGSPTRRRHPGWTHATDGGGGIGARKDTGEDRRRSQAAGVRRQESGGRSQAAGVRRQESGFDL